LQLIIIDDARFLEDLTQLPNIDNQSHLQQLDVPDFL